MIPETFEKVDEEGKVQKHVMVAPSEEETASPTDGAMVKICYKCRKSDYSIVDENNEKENAFEFEVGAGSVIKGLDIGIRTMKIGETAVFKIDSEYAYGKNGSGRINPNETLYFEAELVSFKAKEKSKWDFSPEERVEMAKKLKEEGAKLFGEKKLSDAKEKFSSALDFIDAEKLDGVLEMKIALRNNLALIDMTLKDYHGCVVNCNHVLEFDKKNIKALFKKAKANRLNQDFEEAKESIKLALEAEPENKEVLYEETLLKKDEKNFKQKEKNMFSKVLG